MLHGPKCKRCRREGMKLYLKGARCYTSKCPIETGRPVPGMHGSRRMKVTDFGTQLREKQKLRRYYGLAEGQFRLFFSRAAKRRGITGELLLQFLELRLDNLVYRMGFAPSRRAARQFVLHNHITVDGRKVNVPSMVLKEGAVIGVRSKENSRLRVAESLDVAESRQLSPWLSLDKDKLEGTVVRIPSREEISPLVNEQRIVELYSK